jgi:hypothetical protein
MYPILQGFSLIMRTELQDILRGVNHHAANGFSVSGSRLKAITDALVSYYAETAKKIANKEMSLYIAGKINFENGDAIIESLKNDLAQCYQEVIESFKKEVESCRIMSEPIRKALNFLPRLESKLDDACIQLAREFGEHNSKLKIANSTVTNHTTFGNFQGVYGDVTNSQVTQNLNININPGEWESLATALQTQGIEEADINELSIAIKQDEAISKNEKKLGPIINGWIAKMVGKAAAGTWNFSLITAAGVLTNYISKYLGIN